MYKIAIVGRPNVGKSALFNCICGKRLAIVDECEGITRDRLYAESEFFSKPFTIIDTGGMDPLSSDFMHSAILEQSEEAIKEADSLIMVVDAVIGVTELDQKLARKLHAVGKPITLAVNKIDNREQEALLHQFYSLGIKNIIGVSATHGYQIAELISIALQKESFEDAENNNNNNIQVAVVGRTNVGKSTLINSILDKRRCVVSEEAGTTRDSVDVPITIDSQDYTLVDTAGIRRRTSEKATVEKFAYLRTWNAIHRADVCLLMLDVQDGITTQEKRILQQIEKAGKPCIVLVNKWDLVHGFRMEHSLRAIREASACLAHSPIIFISAKTKRNLDKIFPEVLKTYVSSKKKITTHQLNSFVEQTMKNYPPPVMGGKRLRVYYTTQTSTEPPSFVLFVNNPNLMQNTYKKYLINQLRTAYSYSGTPIELQLRGKSSSKSNSNK